MRKTRPPVGYYKREYGYSVFYCHVECAFFEGADGRIPIETGTFGIDVYPFFAGAQLVKGTIKSSKRAYFGGDGDAAYGADVVFVGTVEEFLPDKDIH